MGQSCSRLFASLICVPLVAVLMACAGTAPPPIESTQSEQAIPSADKAVNADKPLAKSAIVDTLIQPELAVGKITANVSQADLKEIYGAENVVDEPFYIAEGMCEPGTRLFPDDPTLVLDLLWGDKKAQSHPTMIKIHSPSSLWHTVDGMAIGVTATELLKLNKKPFEFSGFSWDYGGYVTSWKGGLFSDKDKGLGVRLDLVNLEQGLPEGLNILGEGTFPSELLKPIEDKVVVTELFFRFQENFERFPDEGDFQKECALVEADLKK